MVAIRDRQKLLNWGLLEPRLRKARHGKIMLCLWNTETQEFEGTMHLAELVVGSRGYTHIARVSNVANSSSPRERFDTIGLGLTSYGKLFRSSVTLGAYLGAPGLSDAVMRQDLDEFSVDFNCFGCLVSYEHTPLFAINISGIVYPEAEVGGVGSQAVITTGGVLKLPDIVE